MEDRVYDELAQICIEEAEKQSQIQVVELMEKMMDYPEVPMHYPYHHFIMPAALLTCTCIEEKVTVDELQSMLNKAKQRAKQIPGGACGSMGTCGAGVGAGIFLSIFTKTTPLSKISWQWTNELTGRALLRIASVPGPRCCKRVSYLSVLESIPYINEKLDLHLQLPEKITCKYYEKNKDCKGAACPFYIK